MINIFLPLADGGVLVCFAFDPFPKRQKELHILTGILTRTGTKH